LDSGGEKCPASIPSEITAARTKRGLGEKRTCGRSAIVPS
jgi:hypothetical protein